MENVKLSLSQEEVNALVSLLDIGVKASGLQSVRAATALVSKIEEAVAESNKPTEE
jgi:hypothetical protein